jgi:hypothetical protein
LIIKAQLVIKEHANNLKEYVKKQADQWRTTDMSR